MTINDKVLYGVFRQVARIRCGDKLEFPRKLHISPTDVRDVLWLYTCHDVQYLLYAPYLESPNENRPRFILLENSGPRGTWSSCSIYSTQTGPKRSRYFIEKCLGASSEFYASAL